MNKEDRRIINLIKVKLGEVNNSLNMLVEFARDDFKRLNAIEKKLGINSSQKCPKKFGGKGE